MSADQVARRKISSLKNDIGDLQAVCKHLEEDIRRLKTLLTMVDRSVDPTI